MAESPYLRVVFRLDGGGIYYDPANPIHLDALIAVQLANIQFGHRHLTRADVPDDIQLPLMRAEIAGTWVWRASALFPDGMTAETLVHWRKRFRRDRATELTSGSPNLTNGVYRDWNMPVPLLLCERLVGYAAGNRREVLNVLRRFRYLGRKRAHGHGRIIDVEIDRTDEDRSLIWQGRAMRWLPDPAGTRLVRPRPPYWNPHGRVPCVDVGDPAPANRPGHRPRMKRFTR